MYGTYTMLRSRQQVATKSWSGGRDGESSSAQAQAQAQEVSVRSQAGRQAEQSLLPCTTRPGRECGGRQITRGDSDAVVLLPVGASSRHPTPKRAARGGTLALVVQTAADGRNCTAACLDRNKTPFASTASSFFCLCVRCVLHTRITPCNLRASVCVQCVHHYGAGLENQRSGLVWMAAFSRSHTSAQWV